MIPYSNDSIDTNSVFSSKHRALEPGSTLMKIHLPDKRIVQVIKEHSGSFVLCFRHWDGAARVDTVFRVSSECASAMKKLLSEQGVIDNPNQITQRLEL